MSMSMMMSGDHEDSDDEYADLSEDGKHIHIPDNDGGKGTSIKLNSPRLVRLQSSPAAADTPD